MTSKPASERLPSLAGLRGVLALVVLFGHMSYMSAIFTGKIQDALDVFVHLVVGLVSAFFTLSGFILTWSHVPGDRPRAFWRRRFWRVFPNYLLAWTIATVLFAVSTTEPPTMVSPEHDPFTSIATLLLVQGWIPDLHVNTGINPPAWSLSCEAFFYLLFPILIILARKIPERRLGVVWAVVTAAMLAMPLVGATIPGTPAYSWLPLSGTSIWFVQAFPLVRLLEFLLGILTARLVQTGRWPRRSLSAGIALLVVALVAIPILPPLFARGAAIALPLCLIIAGLALRDIQHRPSFLTWPSTVRLGDASYALYILHFPLLLVVSTMLGADRRFSVATGVVIVLVLMASAQAMALLVYRYYEKPLARRFSVPRARDREPNVPRTQDSSPVRTEGMEQHNQDVVTSAAPERTDPYK